MNNRADWNSLTLWSVGGLIVVSSSDSAAYLGMHIEAFRQLARDKQLQPDATVGRTGMYTRSTLDALDNQRRKVGRPRNP